MPVNLGPASALPEGRGVSVSPDVTGYVRDIAVFRDGDAFRAVDDPCTHLHASLSQGRCEDGVVTCWLHKGTFDARTGEAVDYPARGALTVHRVDEVDGDLWLTVSESEYRER